MRIKNIETLLSHGNLTGRRTVLDVIEAGLEAADPYLNTRKMLHVDGNKLIVGHKQFDVTGKGVETLDLSKIGAIYVVGAGKAAQRMAKAIEDVLGDRISGGAINVKKGEEKQLKLIEVAEAGHPILDENGVKGTKRILEILKSVKKGDLVFCVVSGGVSALLTLPASGISLENKKEVTRILQQVHGIPTGDVNAVRGNLSVVKEGRMATYVHPAKMIVIMTWGGMKNVSYEALMKQGGTNPFLPSPRTYQDAIAVINRWGVWNEMPQSVRTFLRKADPRYAIPRIDIFDKIDYSVFQVGNSSYMIEGARRMTRKLGLTPILLPSVGRTTEAAELAKVLVEIAKQVESGGGPFRPPCVIISNGESIVTVGKDAATARGGRNQEFAVSAALRIMGSKGITVGAVDSDGTDGPTDVAGGVADGYTVERAEKEGVDLFKAMRSHNTTEALMRLKDAIMTGNTGTNTMDLRAILISAPALKD